MKVCLTDSTELGAAHVLACLLDAGDHVRVLAAPGDATHLRRRARVTVVPGSLEDPAAVAEVTDGVDVVYHLAALSPAGPGGRVQVDVETTEHLLAEVAGRVRRFVFAGSVAVYRPAPWPFLWPVAETHPQATDASGDVARDAQSWIEAEGAIRRCHEEHGIEFVILRSTEVYGPGAQHAERLVRHVASRPWSVGASPGPPGGGIGAWADAADLARFGAMQWVHVRDLADAVVQAGTMPGAANEVINVGGGEVFTARDLAAVVWELLVPGWPPYGTALLGHYGLKFDITKAHRLLGYSPQVRLREGLKELAVAAGEGLGLPSIR